MKMMDIQVKDPDTGALLALNAKPEQYQGIHGFRITRPNGSGFFITSRSGAWRSVDDHHIDAGLLINIGLALEGYPLKEQQVRNDTQESPEQNQDSTKDSSEPYTDNQPNINTGIGDEGAINPNKP
jgi:hypothetical protein